VTGKEIRESVKNRTQLTDTEYILWELAAQLADVNELQRTHNELLDASNDISRECFELQRLAFAFGHDPVAQAEFAAKVQAESEKHFDPESNGRKMAQVQIEAAKYMQNGPNIIGVTAAPKRRN
jgi:hypothetical protein